MTSEIKTVAYSDSKSFELEVNKMLNRGWIIQNTFFGYRVEEEFTGRTKQIPYFTAIMVRIKPID